MASRLEMPPLGMHTHAHRDGQVENIIPLQDGRTWRHNKRSVWISVGVSNLSVHRAK